MGDITQFKELLEEYFVVKNKLDNGDKQSHINNIKNDFYNDLFLNLDFERESGVIPIDSKVVKEFFSEVDKFEVEYMKSVGFTHAELSDVRSGLALVCATEFTRKFERYSLLDTDFKNILIEYQSRLSSGEAFSGASSKKKKRSKSKKHKFKKTKRSSIGGKGNSKRKTNKSNKRRNNKRKYKHK